MKYPDVPFSLVLIEWEDSRVPHSPWGWADEYPEPTSVHCVTVGYLVRETKTTLAIAQNIGDLHHTRKQISGVMDIPKRCVIRKIMLEKAVR